MKKKKSGKCESKYNCSSSDAVYILGVIGAAVYNVSISAGFWSAVFGIIKAFVWPAFVVYKLMGFLGL